MEILLRVEISAMWKKKKDSVLILSATNFGTKYEGPLCGGSSTAWWVIAFEDADS